MSQKHHHTEFKANRSFFRSQHPHHGSNVRFALIQQAINLPLKYPEHQLNKWTTTLLTTDCLHHIFFSSRTARDVSPGGRRTVGGQPPPRRQSRQTRLVRATSYSPPAIWQSSAGTDHSSAPEVKQLKCLHRYTHTQIRIPECLASSLRYTLRTAGASQDTCH